MKQGRLTFDRNTKYNAAILPIFKIYCKTGEHSKLGLEDYFKITNKQKNLMYKFFFCKKSISFKGFLDLSNICLIK